MTQVQEMTSEPAIAAERTAIHFPRGAAIAAAMLLLLGALTLAYVTFSSPGAAPAISTEAGAPGAVDGWLPGIQAANQQALIAAGNQAVDGWSSALLRPAPQVVDGWSGRYLASSGD
jgi:hypothetical protein